MTKEFIYSYLKNNGQKTSIEIRRAVENEFQINNPDISGLLRDLVFFDYLDSVNNNNITSFKVSGRREYNAENSSQDNEWKIANANFEVCFNKVFTGSYLAYSLGHELINFIKSDDGKRFIYLNPLGGIGNAKHSNYVFHIIDSATINERGLFEVAAISQVNHGNEKVNTSPRYRGHEFKSIFSSLETRTGRRPREYSLVSDKLFVPREAKRVFIRINQDYAQMSLNGDSLILDVVANPQHNIAYADASGTKEKYNNPNDKSDLDIIKEFINSMLFSYFFTEAEGDGFDYDSIPREQAYSVISGRHSLEVSTSNLISYFLQRDSKLTYVFLSKVLGIKEIDPEESFEIMREHKNIDLLFRSNKHLIVVENKIDSDINGVNEEQSDNEEGIVSQLSKYYEFVTREYTDLERKYYVLAPLYRGITEEYLSRFNYGSEYRVKTYNDFYKELKDYSCKPDDYLFEEFKKSIELLTWTKAKQREQIAYIRFKQRINELSAQKKAVSSLFVKTN